jgi:hypothetical protein
MSTLNKDMKTEVTAHDKLKALQMTGDTLGLWQLLATVEQGVCVNNFSMLMSKWVAMRYTPGTNVTRFFLNFESLVNQIDHAGEEHEMKMTDSTKCWQLTKAFGENARFDMALGDCIHKLKGDPLYPKYADVSTPLKNTIKNTQEYRNGYGAKKGRAQVMGNKMSGGFKTGNKSGDPKEGPIKGPGRQVLDKAGTPPSPAKRGDRNERVQCWRCGQFRHIGPDCQSKSKKPCKKCHSDKHMTKFHRDTWSKLPGGPEKQGVKFRSWKGGAEREERAYQMLGKKRMGHSASPSSDTSCSESDAGSTSGSHLVNKRGKRGHVRMIRYLGKHNRVDVRDHIPRFMQTCTRETLLSLLSRRR